MGSDNSFLLTSRYEIDMKENPSTTIEPGQEKQGTTPAAMAPDALQTRPWLILSRVLFGITAIFILGYFAWPTIYPALVRIATDDNFSAGLLVPLVIAYIVYRKWPEIRQPWQSSWWGLAILALGFLLFLLGMVLTIAYIAQLAMVILLAGIFWLLGGWRIVRLLAFPFFLIALSIPLPHFFVGKLTIRLQIVSTKLAAEILRLIGYPVGVFGNVIDLGERQLQVVAACSGLGYLITATALAIIFCYFFQRQLWKVALLLFAMVPFAIVANAIRLVIIGIWPIFEKGVWHASIGLSVFMLGLDYLRGLNWLLNRLSPPPTPDADTAAGAVVSTVPTVTSAPQPWYAAYGPLVAGLLLIVTLSPFAIQGVEAVPVPLKQEFRYFPMELGPWRGKHVYIEPELVAGTGADSFLNTSYINPDKQAPVDLWIAYYENQESGKSVHSPNTCLTGSGWKTVHAEVLELFPGKPINFAILEYRGTRMAMFFWYFERGRWLASDYGHKLTVGYDRLVSKRADGALVRLTTMVHGDEAQARARLENFLQQLIPVLPEFIPGKS